MLREVISTESVFHYCITYTYIKLTTTKNNQKEQKLQPKKVINIVIDYTNIAKVLSFPFIHTVDYFYSSIYKVSNQLPYNR